jgi:hypothetical protein
MNKITIALLYAGLCTSVSAFGSEKICPFPFGIQASIGASQEAVLAKNAGRLKADLLQEISKESNIQGLNHLLTDIIHEVYDYPTLDAKVYSAYRFELCFVTQTHPEKMVGINFAEAHPLLETCGQLSAEKDRTLCAMRAARSMAGAPEQ